MKVLNLDELAEVTRQVKLGGVNYDVRDIDVETFVTSLAQAEAAIGGADVSPSEQLKNSLLMVKRAIPDAPDEVLKKLTLPQLGQLLQFIRGELDDGEAGETTEKKSTKAKSKK